MKIDDYFPFEEIPCCLCNKIILHNPKFQLTQDEIDEYFCADCEEKINSARFW